MNKKEIIKEFLQDNILDGSIKVKANIPGVTKSYMELRHILAQFATRLEQPTLDRDKVMEVLKQFGVSPLIGEDEIYQNQILDAICSLAVPQISDERIEEVWNKYSREYGDGYYVISAHSFKAAIKELKND